MPTPSTQETHSSFPINIIDPIIIATIPMNFGIIKMHIPTPNLTLLTFIIAQTWNLTIIMFQAASQQTPLGLFINLCRQRIF